MGRKLKEEKYLRYITNYNITHYSCDNCPAKLFQEIEDKPITSGIGNICSNTIIIYPTYVSINSKLFDRLTDIIRNRYKEKYDTDLLNCIYITPVIKCYCNNANYNIKNAILNKCAIKTLSEIVDHNNHTKIIYLGDAKDIDIIIPNNLYKIRLDCPFPIFNLEEEQEEFLTELFKYI